MANCRLPLCFSIRGTVILRIWWQILISTLFTAAITCIHILTDIKLQSPTSISTALGVVTGMLLVFRTNTAYERFWEGRKIWSEMVYNIRTITRTIWITIDDKGDSKLVVEKLSAVNLLVAFVYATKHYLREEYSRKEPDMVDLISHLPVLYLPSSNESVIRQEIPPIDLKTPKPKSRRRSSSPYNDSDMFEVPTNIPLELTYFISAYIKSCKDRNLVDSPTCRTLDNAVGYLVENLTAFERVRKTPIPLAYSVHLQHVTWIVILSLPFNFLDAMQWLTIPATCVVSFALFGILGIGREIENPFGYDYNDLNLDDFCSVIHKETLAILAHRMPNPSTWLLSEGNRPLITNANISAAQLAKMKASDVLSMLSEEKQYKFSNILKANNSPANTQP